MSRCLINKDLVFIGIDVSDRYELLRFMAKHLEKLSFVHGGFADAVIRREEEYPTGLPAEVMGFAIPHADSSFVEKTTIAVALLKNGIDFSRMDDPDEFVKVSVVIMLAVKEPDTQIELLQMLASSFQDEDFWTGIRELKDSEEIAASLNERLIKR